MKFRSILIFILFLFLVACQQDKKILSDPRNDNEQLSNPAVIQLWTEAEAAKKAQQYVVAERKIQQAIRILPNKAILWSRLAELAMIQKQPTKAEDFAARSNAYSGNNRMLLNRNWLIIKNSRTQRNDQVGSSQAALKLRKLNFK
jgi:Tfp pilus assembly protein PilF